jgi:hypothetical protein
MDDHVMAKKQHEKTRKTALFERLKIKEKPFTFPGEETPVTVRALDGETYLEWGLYCQSKPEGKELTQVDRNLALVVFSVYDADEQLFSLSDIPSMKASSGLEMTRLITLAMEVNGMLNDVKKPSPPTPSAGSATAGQLS